jgi:multiple sugar transport system permease protein/raffinose/stachyose/melibiose transport system permease protein
MHVVALAGDNGLWGATHTGWVKERPTYRCQPSKRGKRGMKNPIATRASGVVLVAPCFALFTGLIVIPFGLLLYLSFTNWDGFNPHLSFIGLSNYKEAFKDPNFGHALFVTGVLTVAGTILCNVLGLSFALMLNRRTRVTAIIRALLFYPQILSALIIGFLWSSILGSGGIINTYLTEHKHSEVPFLSEPPWALWTLVGVLVWSTFGLNVVLYLAGLQTIPENLIEAARVDGAEKWRLTREIRLPLLAPIITLNVVILVVSFLRIYDLVLSLTGGGPASTTQTIGFLVLFESFLNSQLGYGAAEAVMLTIVTAIAAVILIVFRRRREVTL